MPSKTRLGGRPGSKPAQSSARLAQTLGVSDAVRIIPIVDPTVRYSVGLAVPQRDPLTPMIAALAQTAREVAPTLEP